MEVSTSRSTDRDPIKEWKEVGKKPRLSIDFDGTVHRYSKRLHTRDIYDPPCPGTKEALEILSKDFELVLFTARVNAMPNGKAEIEKWLKEHGLLEYFVEVTDQKLPSVKFIDDDAVVFHSWEQVLEDLAELNCLPKKT